MFAYKITSSFLKYSCLDSIKVCIVIISSQTALRVANSPKFLKKTQLESYANYVACNLTPCYCIVFAMEFIMIRLGSLERDYSLFRGVITLDKG